jgi:hypothetical protein
MDYSGSIREGQASLSTTKGAIVGEKDGEARREEIARRAYEISESSDAGTPEENWSRAEHELGDGHQGMAGKDGMSQSATKPKRAPAKKKTDGSARSKAAG